MKLHFDLMLVRRLLDHSRTATERRPFPERLHERRLRRDGQDVDPARIPPGLWLVGDEAVFVMSNGQPPLIDTSDTRNVVAYAREATPPAGTGSCREVTREICDDAVFLDLPFVEYLIARGCDGLVCMDLTPTRIEAVTPDGLRSSALLASPAHSRRTPARRAGRA